LNACAEKGWIMERHKVAFNPSSARSVAAGVYMGVMGGEVFIVQPGFVQGLVERMRFSEEEAGLIASVEMAGFAAMTILLIFLTRRMNWRLLLTGCIALAVVGQLGSMLTSAIAPFSAARFVAGLGCGGIVSIGFAAIGLTDKPDRNFGILVAFSGVYGAAVLGIMPALFESSGMQGLLLFFAAFAALGFPLVRWLPGSDGSSGQAAASASPFPLSLAALALGAMFAYFLAQGVVWAYLFRIAIAGGVSEGQAAFGLTIAQFAGIVGALVPSIVGARYGRAIMLAIAIAAGILPLLYFLYGSITALSYAVAVCVYNFGFNKTHPYLLATMASFDGSGRVVTFAVAMQTLGLAIGPAIGALLLAGNSFVLVQWFGIAAFAASLALILIPARSQAAQASAGT
jgi:predicted MFS family arabinose efflux permease